MGASDTLKSEASPDIGPQSEPNVDLGLKATPSVMDEATPSLKDKATPVTNIGTPSACASEIVGLEEKATPRLQGKDTSTGGESTVLSNDGAAGSQTPHPQTTQAPHASAMDLAAQEGIDVVEHMFSIGDEPLTPDSPILLRDMFKTCKKRRGDGDGEWNNPSMLFYIILFLSFRHRCDQSFLI